MSGGRGTPGTPVRLDELARALDRPFEGDGATVVSGVGSLEDAGPADLAFVRSAQYAEAARRSAAGVLILPEGVDAGGRPSLRSPNPALDFARAVPHVVRPLAPAPGAAASARVAADAQVDPSAALGENVVVGARSRVGPRTVLHPNVTVYPDVTIGADCVLHAGVVLREGTLLGDRVRLQPGVFVGGDGFGYVFDEGGDLRAVPHVGRVVLEDDVEIGAGSTVDRATLGETRIGRGTKIDNLVMVAHNCRIGAGALVVAQTGLAGSTTVKDGAILMARVGTRDHVTIGERAFVGPVTIVPRDVPDGARVLGVPAMPERSYIRMLTAMQRLPEAMRRLARLERRLAALEGDDGASSDGKRG